MLPYCLTCRGKTDSKNPKVAKTKKGKIMAISNSAICSSKNWRFLKVELSGLRRFLAIESPLKVMKNYFYFTSKAFFVLNILKILYWLFGHVTKQLD